MKHLKLTISGKVQGVGFRYFTKLKANELGINGYVVNNPDGTVTLEVEANQEKLDQMLQWCLQGPPSAEVEKVTQQYDQLQDYKNFTIQIL